MLGAIAVTVQAIEHAGRSPRGGVGFGRTRSTRDHRRRQHPLGRHPGTGIGMGDTAPCILLDGKKREGGDSRHPRDRPRKLLRQSASRVARTSPP